MSGARSESDGTGWGEVQLSGSVDEQDRMSPSQRVVVVFNKIEEVALAGYN